MVVLTFLLARAAYNRYNSSGDVDNNDDDTKSGQQQEQGGRRSDNNYPTQSLRHTHSSSSNNNNPSRTSSSQRIIIQKNQSNKRSANRKFHNIIMTSATTNNSQPMIMAEEELIPSNNGHFVINTKAKIIMLPSEVVQLNSSSTATDHVGDLPKKSNEPNSNYSTGEPIVETTSPQSQQQQQPSSILSSKEMTMAMMGELSTTNQNERSMVLLNNGSDNNTTRGSKHNTNDIGGDWEEGEEEQEYMVINNTNTTFRTDVRNEWVDAVFGTDFFPLKEDSSSSSTAVQENTTRGKDRGQQSKTTPKKGEMDIGIKQGIGNANIPHYVTYGAILDATSSNNNINNDTNKKNNGTTNNNKTPRMNKTKHHSTPSLTAQSLIQENTQSTPLIFSSPSSSSLLGLGGGPTSSLLASTSFVSACGGGGGVSPTTGGDGEGGGQGGSMNHNMLFETPGGKSGTEGKNNGARYTIEETPATVGTTPNNAHHHREAQQQPTKLGITISRIPLGLYVHSISFDSEAYTVGISPGSILVEINGMGMLGDRSDRALERLWCYTGLFGMKNNTNDGSTTNIVDERDEMKKNVKRNKSNIETTNTTNNDSSTKSGSGSSTTTTKKNNNQGLQMKKPILLKFYKNGRTYTKLLLSGNPLRGITWAPCGNFALVHKVSNNSIASEAGVRRGTLVVGVNNVGLRTLDHGGVACYLKDKFTSGVSFIRVWYYWC